MQHYDVVHNERQVVRKPDIVIVEGLNVLHVGAARGERPRSPFVSDFFDFSIYLDAEEQDIEQWYVERFQKLRETVFQDPQSYFRHFAALSDGDAIEVAHGIWREINGKNLNENILPTRPRAALVLHKTDDHRVTKVQLRKL